MKFKNFFLGVLASAAVLASCQPNEEQLGAPALNLDSETMEFESAKGEQTLAMTATRDWAVSNDQDWLVFDPTSGSGSNKPQEVKVTVLANPESNRTYEAVFSIGMITKTLTVSQKGDKGEAALEITPIGDFIKAADGAKVCILKGRISGVKQKNSEGKGFFGFDITDETGTVTAAFPANWDEYKDQLKNGQIVTLKGTYQFYDQKKTHQVKDAVIMKIEDGGELPPVEKISIADFISKADGNTVYELCGTISNVKQKNAEGKGFFGFDINDGTATVTAAFPANWDEYKDKLKNGQKVTLQGTYQYYDQKKTHQVKDANILKIEEGEAVPPTEVEKISVADFIKAADAQKVYQLTGKISNVKQKNAEGKGFFGFDLNDGTATVTAAFPANWDEYKDKLKDGQTVTLKGTYQFYDQKKTHQVKDAVIIKIEAEGEGGGDTPAPEKPANLKKVTIKEFLDAQVDGTTWYELTGKITKISSPEYGNFYIEDATGKVYIYGLVKEFVTKNDKSFSSIGLKEGDELTLGTMRAEHSNTPQGGGNTPAFYISHKEGQGGEPSKPDGEAKWAFTSSITYDIVDAAYKEKATINGKADIPVLKIGKGKGYGKANLTIPAGTTKLGFYAVAWKGDAAVLKFGNGTRVELERGNDGATSTNPYTIDGITAIDYYEIDLKGDEGTLSIETVEMGKRAIVFGINPVK